MVTKWSPTGGRHGKQVVFANSPITGYLPPTSRPEACSWELDPPVSLGSKTSSVPCQRPLDLEGPEEDFEDVKLRLHT